MQSNSIVMIFNTRWFDRPSIILYIFNVASNSLLILLSPLLSSSLLLSPSSLLLSITLSFFPLKVYIGLLQIHSLFNFLSYGKYSNLLIVAAFSNISFFGKLSSPVKNLYLPTFPDDKAILIKLLVYLNYNELCFAFFCYELF